ncbi:unnamed protein product [Cuscuta epithymum]|uniref:3'-5' exonuclease domain-containing protein n=1 Tax=Cuscuta epithymum TaxID=186058 RepID=A0AAV0DGZ7_9ASTE|nr:unnamed protein product [Cuscuta epithymum]
MATIHSVDFHNINLQVTVTKVASQVDAWISEIIDLHHRRGHRFIIAGLDIKWHPYRPWNNNLTATLQICVGKKCLVFQLLYKDRFPQSLVTFLTNPLVTFVAIGVQGHAQQLLQDHGLVVGNVLDLQFLATCIYRSRELLWIGLETLAMKVLGLKMDRPSKILQSNWELDDLSFEQITFAAKDAYMSFRIGLTLVNINACRQRYAREREVACN